MIAKLGRELAIIFSLSGGLILVGLLGLAGAQIALMKTARGEAIKINPSVATAQPLPDPTLIIPALNVQAPIVFSASARDIDVLNDLRKGVSHQPGSPKPGERGNVFIVGHSSNYPWERGDYNSVFSNLNKLNTGDASYIDFKGKRYEYRVISKRIVWPNDLSVTSQTNTHNLSLMTCYPTNTTLKRLVVNFQLKQTFE